MYLKPGSFSTSNDFFVPYPIGFICSNFKSHLCTMTLNCMLQDLNFKAWFYPRLLNIPYLKMVKLNHFKPHKGSWNPWTAYSQCTASCGIGYQTRYRNCNIPNTCEGAESSSRTCNTRPCARTGQQYTENTKKNDIYNL